MSHYRHKPDANTEDIATAFEKLGCTVDRTNGKWDLTAGWGGLTLLVEVRQAGQPRKARKGRQQTFHDYWTGGLYWAQDTSDVERLVAMLRNWHRLISA